MANIPRYNDDKINNKGMEVDFDLRKVFNMPTIEQLIFFHVNFDKCRKEIITYEKAIQDSSSRISIYFFFLCNFLKAGKEMTRRNYSRKIEMELVLEQEHMSEQETEHPQDQTRGEPLFLINYINIFNSRGQFPSYLIF